MDYRKRIICKMINQHIEIDFIKQNGFYFVSITRHNAGYSSLQYQQKHDNYNHARNDYYQKLKDIDEAYSSQILEAMDVGIVKQKDIMTA